MVFHLLSFLPQYSAPLCPSILPHSAPVLPQFETGERGRKNQAVMRINCIYMCVCPSCPIYIYTYTLFLVTSFFFSLSPKNFSNTFIFLRGKRGKRGKLDLTPFIVGQKFKKVGQSGALPRGKVGQSGAKVGARVGAGLNYALLLVVE